METAVAPATKLPLVHASVAAPVAPADEAKPDAVAKRTAEQPEPNQRKRQRLDDAQGLQFIALTRAHLAGDMSEEYQKAAQTRSEVDANGASSAADGAVRHDPGGPSHVTAAVGPLHHSD